MSRLFYMPQAVRVNSAGLPYAGAKANFYLTTTTTRTDSYTDNALAVAHANPVVADAAGQFAAIYLNPAITYKVVITDSADNVLDTVDPVHSPFTAASVSIVDSGGYFAGTDLETVLADIGANYAVLADDEDISGDWVVSGSVNFQDNVLKRAMVQDSSWLNQALTSAASITWNLENGQSATLTLGHNVTLTVSNWVASDDHQQAIIKVKQDSAGGAYTLAFAGTVTWGGGSAPSPVMTTGNDSERVFILKTWDGGTTVYIDYAGAYG